MLKVNDDLRVDSSQWKSVFRTGDEIAYLNAAKCDKSRTRTNEREVLCEPFLKDIKFRSN